MQIDGRGLVTIDGQGGSGDGLVFETASYSPNTLQSITIQNFSGSGVVVNTTSSDSTTLQGVTLAQNGLDGLRVKASKEVKVLDNCTIKGNWKYGVNVQNDQVPMILDTEQDQEILSAVGISDRNPLRLDFGVREKFVRSLLQVVELLLRQVPAPNNLAIVCHARYNVTRLPGMCWPTCRHIHQDCFR